MSDNTSEQRGGITINDIARELNISPSTVSRALNDSSKISEKTRNEVKAVAARLGYQLNQTASALSKNKTDVIGVLLPRLNSHFFSRALGGIEEAAHAAGYRILICQSNDNRQQESEMIKLLLSSRVDGVVASLSMDSNDGSHFDILTKNRIPVAMFDRVSFNIPGPKVIIDNYDAAFKATEHLITNGYKRIAYLSGLISGKLFEERLNGFKDALTKHNIPIEPQMVLSCNLDEKDTREAFNHWMRMEHKPDAIFTSSASSGLIICALAKAAGISIPSEMGIISFGNEPCHEIITPPLSSVDVSGEEMGRLSTELLIETIENKTNEQPLILVPFKLLIRNSSFRP